MFLLCNGILAFLANNMKLNLNYGGFLKRFDEEDGHDEHLPQMLLFQENAASMEYVDHTPSDDAVSEEKEIQDDDGDEDEDRENEMMISLESEEWGEEEEDDDDEVEENAGVDDTSSVNDMRVSTEELNKKFDEFIRKMKEGIRIEAQQQYMILV
ncbi:hypothetical protein C2S53_004667 [Perilla frutescens var. hirtella]|uniref:Uncharacterized protein n=1 Tax=Perilla frutescens var. hirtella TaxID=608512 RepID=A0AAD4JJ80_PERFH|nr:hypothetical protein C2S53_004667 [Perilla frutescens var. hirtella]